MRTLVLVELWKKMQPIGITLLGQTYPTSFLNFMLTILFQLTSH